MGYKYIADISKEDLDSVFVFPCLNEDKKQCIIIKNKNKKNNTDTYHTDNLAIFQNKVLSLDSENYYVHLLECKLPINDDFDIIYNYVFNHITCPIADSELFILVKSLEEYFKVTPEKDLEQFRIGVFGELLTIKKLYSAGYTEILDKYHKNFYSKHDIEISKNVRIEIKTTPSEKRIHTFKHDQIYRDDLTVYVASSLIEIAQDGLSLFDLFSQVIKIYNNPVATFELNKLKKKCKVSEHDHGIVVSEEKAMKDLLFYDTVNLPRFECPAPKGVTNIGYDVDCSLADDIDTKTFVEKLKVY